jgi:hypothetical protein
MRGIYDLDVATEAAFAALLYHRQRPCANPNARAFSSEVHADSRDENASKPGSKTRF